MFFFLRRYRRVTESDAQRYVEQRLAARGSSGQSFALETPYHIERLTNGTNRSVYKLTSANADPVVLRLLKSAELTEHHFEFNRYLAQRGFPVPEILYEDRSKETLRGFGCAVSVERFITGDPFAGNHRTDPALINAVAGLMARFHAVTSDKAGLPWRPESRPGFDLLMDQISQFHERALKTGLIEKSEMRGQHEWFDRWREPLASVRPYNLVHGDLNWANVIVRPGGEVCVLDFMSTHFGYFELDLAESDRSLFGGNVECSELFLRNYFDVAGPAMRERYDRHKLFFQAYVNLEKASSNAVKAAKVAQGRKKETKPYEEKSRRHLAALRAMIE